MLIRQPLGHPTLATYHPNVVLLHAGTNDVSQGHNPRDIANDLGALIDQIRAGVPGAEVFVAEVDSAVILR
jgi:lysophospholipase L1-like esterase